jgi:hypothetical protein
MVTHANGTAERRAAEIMLKAKSKVSGALSPSCAVRSDPEDVADLDWIGSHIWLTI